jgi:hypothetical protein
VPIRTSTIVNAFGPLLQFVYIHFRVTAHVSFPAFSVSEFTKKANLHNQTTDATPFGCGS